ncbi:MAG: hypothetical protein QXW82_06590 [Candidatus Bathyarchaeia archaeon]
MLDFIIYTQPRVKRGIKAEVAKDTYSLNELWEAPKSSTLKELEKIVKQGTLKFTGEIGEYRCYLFTCKYLERHGPSLVEVERPLEFWQSKEGAFVISFGFPRTAARVGISLLSLAIFGDPTQITPFPISKPDFLRLKDAVKKLGGTITLMDVRKASWGEGVLRQLMLKGLRLENIPGLDEVLERADSIKSLGFMFRSFRTIDRKLSFRLVDWGGGQIYTPADPQPHERAELFKLLEESILGIT